MKGTLPRRAPFHTALNVPDRNTPESILMLPEIEDEAERLLHLAEATVQILVLQGVLTRHQLFVISRAMGLYEYDSKTIGQIAKEDNIPSDEVEAIIDEVIGKIKRNQECVSQALAEARLTITEVETTAQAH
jgi:hypothetical protein